ncbi:MAG: hypothetical protein IPJ46_23745 [Anaerolineales bacterium]|nr:hypothetical protein [Anaerolineales bacterium]
MTNISHETIYKPKYNGSMRFAMVLFPVWIGLFFYFLYQFIVTRSYSPQGLLTVIFGIMAFSLPFRVFREARFGDKLIVKRYLLPDLVIEYKDVIAFDKLRLDTANKGVSLYMINHDSFEELEQIIHGLMSARKIKLKKK